MTVARGQSIAMVDFDHVAIAARGAGCDDAASGCCHDGPAEFLAQIDTGVHRHPPGERVGPPAEGRCDFQVAVEWLAKRDLADDARETILIDYLSAYIEGVRWVLTPANRKAATALLSERMSLTHDVAALCLEQICDPVLGFRPDAALDIPGMEKVLSLRANFRGLQDHPPIGKYYGGQFYQRALTSLQQ